MERLPYIDEHATSVHASRDDTWSALRRVMAAPPGFVLDEAAPPARLAFKGRHPFAVYRLVFELDELGPQRTRLRALTWAVFPGRRGKVYRALVIGTGGHRVAVNLMLGRIAAAAYAQSAPV
jgi:hypothetical protein